MREGEEGGWRGGGGEGEEGRRREEEEGGGGGRRRQEIIIGSMANHKLTLDVVETFYLCISVSNHLYYYFPPLAVLVQSYFLFL